MHPKWVMQGTLSNGQTLTEPCSEEQVAEYLGSKQLSMNMVSTQRPTMHQSELLGIYNSVKFADWQ